MSFIFGKKNTPKEDNQITGSTKERELFWNLFEEELQKQGNPFSINHKDYFATINNSKAISNYCLSIDFLLKKRYLRVGIYMFDNIPAFEYMYSHKAEIEGLLGFQPIWTMSGEKKPTIRRIEIHIPFEPYDKESYSKAIEYAIPQINKFIQVIPKYSIEKLFNC